MSRPTIFLRQVLPAVDKTALDLLPNYGTVGDDVIPKPVSTLLFRWSSSLHLCVLLLGWCLRRVWSQRISPQATSLITTMLVFSSIATLGALGALLFDAMEVGRHVMPFLLVSRLALVSALLLLVLQLDTLTAAASFIFSPTRRASRSSDDVLSQLPPEPHDIGSGVQSGGSLQDFPGTIRNNESCPSSERNTAPHQAGVSPETPQSPAFFRGK